MGCFIYITSAIIDKKAYYILAVIVNELQLLKHTEGEYRFGKTIDTNTTDDLDQRCIETCKCSIISNFHFMLENNNRCKLNTIIKIESTREFKNSKKPIETLVRYCILNVKANHEDFQKAIRLH